MVPTALRSLPLEKFSDKAKTVSMVYFMGKGCIEICVCVCGGGGDLVCDQTCELCKGMIDHLIISQAK